MNTDRLEIQFPATARLSDQQFFALCQENKALRFERTRQGNLLIMSPTGGKSSYRNSWVIFELMKWNETHGLGVVLESNGGFILPDTSVKAPDAAWVRLEQWESLTEQEQSGFLPLCPDFVIELMSPSDRLSEAQKKMEEWMINACRLAWLIHPEEEKVYIYRAGQATEVLKGFSQTLSGEGVLVGFALRLERLR